MIPPHDRYIEVFAGGLSMFFRKKKANVNIINDLDSDIVNLYESIRIDYDEFKQQNDISKYSHIIFTGPIDDYFKDKGLEKLEYRSIDFGMYIYKDTNYFQPNSVVNYPETNVPYTRIVEYKHFLNQKSKHTIIVTEISKDDGDPYYPVQNDRNKTLYNKYKKLAEEEEKNNIFFVGRLANYKYFNMDQAIENALNFFNTKLYVT